jgi:hypothetical protein
LIELILTALAVSICIYPAVAPFNSSKHSHLSLDQVVPGHRDAP